MLEYRAVLGAGRHISTMSVILILGVVLPIVGAVGVLVLSHLPAARPGVPYVALGSAVLTAICAAALALLQPEVSVFLARGSTLTPATDPTVHHEPAVAFLAFAVALASLAALLVDLSHSHEIDAARAASILGLLAPSLLSLWAGSPLILVGAWALYDVILCAGNLRAGVSAAAAVRALATGGAATFLLWAGSLLHTSPTGEGHWAGLAAGGFGTLAILGSGVIRLRLYPAHLGPPDQPDHTPPLSAPLLLGPALGWALWMQVAADAGGAVPGAAWAGPLAAAALAAGGFLAWAKADPAGTLPELAMASAGGILLASCLATDGGATVLAAGAISWVLGVTVLALFDPPGEHPTWWAIPGGVATLSLLGAPLTLGFVAGAHLMRQAMVAPRLVETLAVFVGNSFLVASLLRRWTARTASEERLHGWPAVVRGLGLGLPAALLVVGGLHPPLLTSPKVASVGLAQLLALPGWTGWFLWIASLTAGTAIAWQDSTLRPRIELVLAAARDLIRLEWLYEAAGMALERGLQALQKVEHLVTGRGALLWSILLLVIALAWSG
jgi:hypothetical protein